MNYFESFIDDLNAADLKIVETSFKPIEELCKKWSDYIERVNGIIEKYKETGTVPDLSCIKNLEDCNGTEHDCNKETTGKSSLKENVKPEEKKEEIKTEKLETPLRTSRRTRKNPLPETTQNVERSTRTRKTKKGENDLNIKREKLSTASSQSDVEQNKSPQEISPSATVKTEMPPPTKPVGRKKKKKHSVQVKKENIEEDIRAKKLMRDSDVIVEDPTITTINLVESSDEGEKTIIVKQERMTDVQKKKTKRSRTSSSSDNDVNKTKKISKLNERTITNESEIRDENTVITTEETNPAADATFVARRLPEAESEPKETINTTVIVEDPKLVKNLLPQNVEDMMTDDESDEETKKKNNPPKPVRAIPKPTKPVFSPFAQSPVKQKVKAFEKLQEQANAATATRVTRTKTRKEQEKLEEQENLTDAKNVKEKAKFFTPGGSKFLPKVQSTGIKASRPHNSSTSNESLLSAKSASALKASQAEYRERERKRREKEQEALKKKEALIQAQIEEKKRKREEKQMKAQQQRELLEKDKMKALEVQKLKDERHRKLMAEQEEKKQRLREETEKKRILAKMRALEEKKKEEEKRLEEQRKYQETVAKLAKRDGDMVKMLEEKARKKTPIYMKTRAPLLPTQDCYDSDDEEARGRRYILPEWNRESNLGYMTKYMSAAGEAVKNTFFSIQATTPDLQDIFEVIEPQKLKRSSSAIWHKKPRFTMLPGLEKHDETEEFDEFSE